MNHFSGRRSPTSPAISAASPAALLDVLIELTEQITALRAHAFPVHRRNARKIIRLGGAVLELCLDISGHDHAALDTPSVTLSFTELHVALHRGFWLVRECATLGARMWLLARYEAVSDEFRAVGRSVSTALDVLRFSEVGFSPEAKELLSVLAEQKSELGTDYLGCQTGGLVWGVIEKLKNGALPSRAVFRRIVEHLGVQSWEECCDEISYLEEIAVGSDERAAFVADKLVGMMVYCRAVLFDNDRRTDGHKRGLLFRKESVVTGVNGDDLRCPISLDFMRDPVTVSTGQTYDRNSILQWFRSGRLVCPVTGEELENAALVPNTNLKNIVEDFCANNGVPLSNSTEERKDKSKNRLPLSSANAGASIMTAEFLVGRLQYGSEDEKRKAVFEIRCLSKSRVFFRACFIEAGAVPHLLTLLCSSNQIVQDDAVAALMYLSKHEGGRAGIVSADGVELLADTIKLGAKAETRQNAAATLHYISSVDGFEIGETSKAFSALVGLLKESHYRSKKNAVVALFGLLQQADNRRRILAAKAVPALANLLESKRGDLRDDAVTVLAKIGERREGAAAIVSSGVVTRVAEVLRATGDQTTRERCVSLLLSACDSGGEGVVRLLEQTPVFLPTLFSVMSDGSPRACRKAKMLVKYVHLVGDSDCPIVVDS